MEGEEGRYFKMWEILDISIPAVVLIPLIAIGAVIWVCLQQNARSSDVRRAEFQRLRRLAMEEHERAERELEQEYMRHKPVDSPGGDFPRRRPPGPPGNGYGNVDRGDVGLGGYGNYANNEADARRRKQAENEDHRRKQGEVALRRRQAEEEERLAEERRKEAEFNRRKAAAAEELRLETEERKRREAEEEMRRRQSDEQDWQRRRADLEAQARREAEEERRRQAAAEEEERQKRWKQEESQRLEAQSREAQINFSPRKVHPSNLTCVVCEKPTKQRRRCSRCKSMNYWYILRFRKFSTIFVCPCFLVGGNSVSFSRISG